jgi:hypothetical protein
MYPHLIISNLLPQTIHLRPIASLTQDLRFESGTKSSIVLSNTQLTYELSLSEGFAERTFLSLTAAIRIPFVLDGTFVELEVTETSMQIVAVFRKALIPQALMITNLLPTSAVAVGQDEQVFLNVCEPMSTAMIAYSHPFENRPFFLHLPSSVFRLDLVDVNRVEKCGDLFVKVAVESRHRKFIIVSDHEIVPKKSRKTEKVVIACPRATISIIDYTYRELALLSWEDINFRFTPRPDITRLSLSVRQIQIDDLHPLAQMPVVLCGSQVDGLPWLELKLASLSSPELFVAIEEFSLCVHPVRLFIDVGFCNDLLRSLRSLPTQKKKKIPMPASKHERHGRRTETITAKRLMIDPLVISLNVRSKTGRPSQFEYAYSYMNYIPDITDGLISMPAIDLSECIMTKGFVETQIMDPFKSAMIKQGMKLMLSLDILFNPATFTGNITRQLEKLSKGRLASIAAIGASPLLQFGSHLMNGASKLLHFMSFDDERRIRVAGINQTAKETVIGGIELMGEKIAEGADSVLWTPVEGVRNEGVLGVLAGIGEGFLDLVSKPVLGFVDAGIGLIHGARKAIDGEEVVFRRVRLARVFPLKMIRPVDPFCWKLQNAVQLASLSLKTYSERLELVFQDLRSKRWVCIGEKFLAVVDNDLVISGLWSLDKMDHGVSEGKKLELGFKIRNEEPVVCSFITSDEEIACRAAMYAVSQANYLLIGE